MQNLKLLLACNLKAELARRSFWEFCKLVSPDFYKDSRTHLKTICDTLQALYEGRLIKNNQSDEWQIVDLKKDGVIICKKLMLNIPPQHGKTRTLVNFATWMFGKNPQEKVITGSYNDSTAGDFSRYTRDAIDVKESFEDKTVYCDIFPKTRIKKGNAGFEKWALEGAHFSYLGVGIGGSVTSKGASVLIVDDPIKSAEDALNENNLDRIWLWYTSTFQSRVSAEDGEPIEVVCMTRWSKKDICGRILDGSNGKDWYQITMKAFESETDTMLCPQLFNRKRYFDLKELIEPGIFNANYLQEPLDKSGVLFQKEDLKRFSLSELRKEDAQAIMGYIDVMDDGTDSLAFALGYIYQNAVYITDVVFTSEKIDNTLPACVSLLESCKVVEKLNGKEIVKQDFNYVRVEANNQGGGFIRLLRQHLPVDRILSVKNSANKNTRILIEYGFIKKYFHFRNDYEKNSQYAKFMDELFGYMKDGSSKHDDAPDCTSGFSKMCKTFLPELFK